MAGSAALAKTPSDYAEPRDAVIPQAVTAKLEVSWEGRPWWWAMGECAAWHRRVRGLNMLHQDNPEPDQRMMDFISPMLERLIRDRGMALNDAMVFSRTAMDETMIPRVSMQTEYGGGEMWDSACDKLLAAYKKTKF